MGVAEGVYKDGYDLGKWRRMWKGMGRKQKKQDFESHICYVHSRPLSVWCMQGKLSRQFKTGQGNWKEEM